MTTHLSPAMLREACLVAGLVTTDQPGKTWHALTPYADGQRGKDVFVYKAEDPALPAYVASVLVGMVREKKGGSHKLISALLNVTLGSPDVEPCSATDTARILAAYYVLTGKELSDD